jgi:hypothetical protein
LYIYCFAGLFVQHASEIGSATDWDLLTTAEYCTNLSLLPTKTPACIVAFLWYISHHILILSLLTIYLFLKDESVVPLDDPCRQEQPLTQFQLLKFQEMHNHSQASHAHSPHVQAWQALNSRVPTLIDSHSALTLSTSANSPPDGPSPGGKSVPSRHVIRMRNYVFQN